MATDSPASERPLQGLSAYLRAEANVRDVFAPCPSFEVSIEQLRGWAAAVDALADRAASAPQAVRMLTLDEVRAVWETCQSYDQAGPAIQRKFCEVNDLAIVPLAPQDTGGKK